MKKILLLVAFSLAAVACDKENKNIFENAKEAAEEKDLQGKTFQAECSAEPLNALLTGILSGGEAAVKSSRVQYSFEGANITRTTILYAQADCVGEAFTYQESGEFNVTKNQKTSDGASFIDINYKSLMLKINSDVGMTAANAVGLCGATDWAMNQEREVTAQAKDLNCYGATVPRTNLNIYRIDGGNVLFLGTPGDENNQARPTALSNVQYTAK